MPEWAPDLDHDLAQLVRLQDVMTQPDYKTEYPKTVRRAIDVAYAAHFRALLEFFHDGRPKGLPLKSDLTFGEVTGEPSPFKPYNTYARQRLEDADKLVGHLTKLRRTRTSDWGNHSDWQLIWPMIRDLLSRPAVAPLLSETLAAISSAGLNV